MIIINFLIKRIFVVQSRVQCYIWIKGYRIIYSIYVVYRIYKSTYRRRVVRPLTYILIKIWVDPTVVVYAHSFVLKSVI